MPKGRHNRRKGDTGLYEIVSDVFKGRSLFRKLTFLWSELPAWPNVIPEGALGPLERSILLARPVRDAAIRFSHSGKLVDNARVVWRLIFRSMMVEMRSARSGDVEVLLIHSYTPETV